MESKDLRYFLEVAKTGSFSQAAVNLHTVQSNVTSHIKKLETEFNKSLFNRNKNAITLTAYGEELLTYAEQIIPLLDQANRKMKEKKSTFKIGTTLSISQLLAPYIKQCVEIDPTTSISIGIFTSEQLLEKKYTANLDCTITNNQEQIVFDINNQQFIEQLVLIYPLDSSNYVTDLNSTIIVSNNTTCAYRKALMAYLKTQKYNPVVIEFESLSGVINSVELGLGSSLVPLKSVEFNPNIQKVVLPELAQNLLTVTRQKTEDNFHYQILLEYMANLFEPMKS